MQSAAARRNLVYAAVLAGCLLAGTLAGWTPLGVRVDHYAYDVMTRMTPVADAAPQSVIVAIDEETLSQRGMRNIRPILTDALEQLAAVQPKVVALDVILSDRTEEADDARLEAAMRQTKNLVLHSELVGTKWEEPLPRFKAAAAALGHVNTEQDRLDGVTRDIALEETGEGRSGRERRWALSLEAFRISRGEPITESPDDLEISSTVIPASRTDAGRRMMIRYLPSGIPRVSALSIAQNSQALRGKVVFLGVTALGVDRSVNPYGQNVPGVEVHAHAFETMAAGHFLKPPPDLAPLGLSLAFTVAAALAFALLPGWTAYLTALGILAIAHIAPVWVFRQGLMFPYFGPVAVAWLSSAAAATFQHFFVRRQLRHSESEKSRYQQAIHWAAHEMRTPLTSIQGSSEIMSNYALPEAKRKQLSEMINSESKRLARLIQTFLDVERLAEGQMELKREVFAAADVIGTCLDRVAPIAERKRIRVSLDTPVTGTLTGDRELMEYAFYNLLTNAVKYSPADTHVSVTAEHSGGTLRVAVADQGIGMDAKELRSIFKKFYRTERAEQSGEAGTGIGLSIVEQIVTHHGGRMEVSSEPGKGSCFTMILRSAVAETADR